ncbi:sporulation protein YqfC [Alkalicella caledoniensis]|uniref:Sporulation protein YqfC n=1 Tax=Alkalicella caledoniensis TaxID=2731377 RepID=A0A7G9W4E5_ALKCA|nr:sporulation protein YqfC [Alkalicella caledoniensis]QNO13557.1 sporulation protein YqfC [Alkalicella caledoniensis]
MAASGDKIKRGIADFFDVPKDIVLNLPRIIVIGQLQLYIENHQGIREFKENLVKIRLPQGELEIKGTNLVIRNIYSEDLMIDGEIKSIEFINIEGEK